MPREAESWDEAEQRVLREALRLGFEVGFRGEIENVDWVQSKYKELVSEASKLGIVNRLVEKYEAGREFGKKKRLSSALCPDGGFIFPKRYEEPPCPMVEPPQRSPPGPTEFLRFSFRVAPEEAVRGLSEIIRMAEQSEMLRERIGLAFACLADAHDMLARLERYHGDAIDVMIEGLQILIDIGWLLRYDIVEIDTEKCAAMIEAESVLARQIGQSSRLICKPLCIALETIGSRAFGKPISVTERRCLSQGEKMCKFVLAPRRIPI